MALLHEKDNEKKRVRQSINRSEIRQ